MQQPRTYPVTSEGFASAYRKTTRAGRILMAAGLSAILLPLLTLPSHAQSLNRTLGTAEAVSEVTAQILQANVNMMTLREINLAKVQPSEGEIYVHPVTNPNAGLMKAEGAPQAPVQITFPRQLNLTHETGQSTLTFYYELAGNNQENQSTAQLITNQSQNFQLNAEGEFYIWVGGRINIQNAIGGNYEGEFTVEVEYI